jgi:UDP-N-acetylglucosamine 2-epimerase (non-hydrolysing)
MRIDVRRGEPRAQPPEPARNADPRRTGVVHKAKSVLCVVGTRPEVIKMAPVIRALRNAAGLSVSVLSSGQHRDLLAPLVDWFEVGVDSDLRVMTQNQSLSELTARLIRGFEERLSALRPDLVLAQGDTTTVLCAALGCFYLNIPFGHVEAGLRTFEPRNPFPEEFNRVAVGRLATLHFCPTVRARDNLLAERVHAGTVQLTGNTVIDALQFTTAKLRTRALRAFDHDILLTAHRRENFGAPLVEIFGALLELCRRFPRLKVLYPVHPNPNVRTAARQMLVGQPQISLVEPLDYPELVAAMQASKLILTDSGGIQEEAPALAKPVLVLRGVTERPEAIEIGSAKLVGSSRSAIVAEVSRLLLDPAHYASMAPGGSPYGDGRAAQRIRDTVCRYLRVDAALTR